MRRLIVGALLAAGSLAAATKIVVTESGPGIMHMPGSVPRRAHSSRYVSSSPSAHVCARKPIPKRAARRAAALLPPPYIIIGPPGVSGFGVTRAVRPSYSNSSPVHAFRRT